MLKKFKKNFLFWILGFLLIPSLILNFALFQKLSKTEQGILVIEVLDGDTLLLEGKVKLRLRHLDAPELEYCGGKESKEFLEGLVKGKKIDIQEKILDQWGRPMALVYLKDKLINEEILKNGWGRWHNVCSI